MKKRGIIIRVLFWHVTYDPYNNWRLQPWKWGITKHWSMILMPISYSWLVGFD